MSNPKIQILSFSLHFNNWIFNAFKNLYDAAKLPFPTLKDYKDDTKKEILTSRNQDFLLTIISGGEL